MHAMLRRLSPLAFALALLATAAPHAAAIPAKAPAAGPKMVLPWIEDDWSKAVATARARKVPIFVESWAPW
jgi:hypothetical protein